jgi:hypothetical protein
MTEEFKEQLLAYFTNTTEFIPRTNYETFQQTMFNDYANILENYSSDGVVKCVKQVVAPNNIGAMWTILALWSNTLQKGRFVILDEFNQIVSIIDEYTSGADIGCYYGLELDEKGRLYGIEYLPSEDRVRFIMLNNISIPKNNTYYADIRKTYNVPTLNGRTPVKNESGIAYLTKVSNYAKYCIVVYNTSNWSGNIYTFEIGEEGATTWKEQMVVGGLFTSQKPFIEYNNNNMFSSRIVGITPDTDVPFILRISYTETDSEITRTYDNIGTDANGYISQPTDIIWIDSSNIIVPFTNTTKDKLILQKINIDNEDTFTTLYTEDFPTNQCQVLFTKTNNYDFMYVLGRNYGEVDYTDGAKLSVYHIYDPLFNHTVEESIEEYNVYDEDETSPNIPDWQPADSFIVSNQYNLYNFLISHFETIENEKKYYTMNIQEIYNENNYNGNPYNAYNLLAGQQMILYNIDNVQRKRVLLARNVYNKTTNGNIANYSLQIPNYMLNATEIENIEMLSETKRKMNSFDTTLLKNIYEEVIVVINNKINMINNNDETNPIILNDNASRLNGSITFQDPSRTNAQVNRAKVNYTDNTNEIKTLTVSRIGQLATLSFELEVSKEISSIEFINYDTEYSYLTITPNLEIGKTYTISQDVRIGD